MLLRSAARRAVTHVRVGAEVPSFPKLNRYVLEQVPPTAWPGWGDVHGISFGVGHRLNPFFFSRAMRCVIRSRWKIREPENLVRVQLWLYHIGCTALAEAVLRAFALSSRGPC